MTELSIIIISYNTQQLTRECLQSVFTGMGSLALQVIVVDNNSTDGSREMIEREFPSVRLIANSDNRGFAAANNQGIELALGKYILLLNSDTLVLGDVLTRSVQYMHDHPRVGAMGCRVLNPDRTLQLTCSSFPSVTNLALMTFGLDKLRFHPWLDRYRLTRWDRTDERAVDVVTGCFLLTRRATLDEIGLLDESFFFYGEETDWCRRCADAGWQVRFAPVGEIVHYGSASSRSLNHRRDLLLSRGLIHVNRKHHGRLVGWSTAAVLLVFNVTRCVAYSMLGLVGHKRSRSRGIHFGSVVRGFATAME